MVAEKKISSLEKAREGMRMPALFGTKRCAIRKLRPSTILEITR